MNVERISQRIGGFIANNQGTLRDLPAMQTQILELAAAVAAGDHYESFGYVVEFQNPRNSREFVVKSSSRGYPWNFSRILVKRDGREFEIHMNLSVRSARDTGVYCVDIGVTESGIVPRQQERGWACMPNPSLITFAEVKKLVVYPMLLAHFIGIVHELAPTFLLNLPPQFEGLNHFAPALITLGYCTANSAEIVGAYPTRGIAVNIEANFDDRFSDGSKKFRFGEWTPAASVGVPDRSGANP
jgi:hypothetical protein